MSEVPPSISLFARVAAAEQPALTAAANRLGACLAAAGSTEASVTLTFDPATGGGGFLILSPLVETGSSDAMPMVEARWREMLARYGAAGFDAIFLCTIFHHVTGKRKAELLERIRRLNRLMIHLSQATGAAVIDIDRILSFYGASFLETDYRLGGSAAAGLAGHVCVSAFFEEGLGAWISPDVEQQARKAHGSERELRAFVTSLVNEQNQARPAT